MAIKVPTILDPRYNTQYRVAGWTNKCSIRYLGYNARKLVQRLFPEFSQEDHIVASQTFAKRRRRYAKQHGNLLTKAREKYLPGESFPNFRSGGTHDKFPDEVNNQLRHLAQIASSCHSIAWAHWVTAKRSNANKPAWLHTPSPFVYTE